MWGDIAIAFLLAFITAYVITPYTIRLARKVKAIDVPKDNRKIHKKVMPRLGGIAVILGFTISVIYLFAIMSIEGSINLLENQYYIKLIGFFSGVVVLSIFCFIDDVRGINAIIKLVGQIIAATIVAYSGIIIESNFGSSILITIIWIVGITNAINLIDGLDGLSSGISIIACVSLLIIFSLNGSHLISIILATALAGSLLGFIPFNFNPARTFIGDTGSNFLGFSLSIIAILGMAKTYTAVVLIAPLIIFALPLVDTGFAIVRRIIKNKSFKAVFEADKEHLHHKILKQGYNQKQAVFILYGISASFGMFAIILIESGLFKALSFGLMIIAIAAIGYKDITKLRDDK